MSEKNSRKPSTSIAFEVPCMAEIREVSGRTGLSVPKVRAIVMEAAGPAVASLVTGKVYALVMESLTAGYRRAAAESLEENS